MSISKMIARGRKRGDILREMKKCVILCSNCHLKYHYGDDMVSVKRKSRIEKYIIRLKNEGKCLWCKEKAPCCLQFDHIEPEMKCFNITEGIRQRRSFEEVEEEIKKCRLLCSNCHRKITNILL